jgi:hypothetical protein
MDSPSWDPVHLRARHEVTALVVAASPSDAKDCGLADFDPKAEIARARRAMEGVGVRVDEVSGPNTLDQLDQKLQAKPPYGGRVRWLFTPVKRPARHTAPTITPGVSDHGQRPWL